MAGGFLDEVGLKADYSVMTPNKTVPGALRDGSVQVGQLAVSSSWPAMEQGEPNDILHFAQINERDGFFLAARERDPQFTWDKLAGGEVLVDHFPQPLAMFKYAVHKMGVDYDAIKAMDVGNVEQIEQAFCDGQGEYVHLQGPMPQQLEKDGIGYVVASVGEAIGPVAFSSLASTREWLQSESAKTFMGAYRKARQYVNEAPAEQIATAEANFFPDIDIEVLAHTIATYQQLGCWNLDPHISEEHYETALDVFLHSGLIKKRHPFDKVVVSPPDE